MTASHFARGNAHYRKGALEKAVASYKRAIEGRPDFHVYHYNLAKALHGLGRTDEARLSLVTARKLQPESSTPLPDLATPKPKSTKQSPQPALPTNRAPGWSDHKAVKAMLEWVPPNEQELIDQYRSSPLSKEPDTFALVRIIGNDLVPRHAKGQSRANVRFVLENEPELKDCTRLWVVNRIFDQVEKQAIIDLLEKYKQQYIEISFDEEEYRKIGWDFQCLPEPGYLASQAFHQLKLLSKDRARTALYRLKNLYLINNNGARNFAWEYGRKFAKWVLPWDGNCFVTRRAWYEICASVTDRPHLKYFMVPMQRILENESLLEDQFIPEPIEEPQLLARHDAKQRFDERFPYGRRPKVNFLWALGVPGPWDNWKDDPWEQPRSPLSAEAGQWGVAGWVARMFSGVKQLENQGDLKTFRNRGRVRQEAIVDAINKVDQLVHFAQSTKANLGQVIFYDKAELDRSSALFKAAGEKGLNPVAACVLKAANKALKEGPFSVVQKTTLPPSGDPQDYWHPAPYWWPNPDKDDGLPFVRKEGQRVPGARMYEPESHKYYRTRVQLMFDNATALALAWRITGDLRYARHGVALLEEWFVRRETRMNPHLNYSQVRMGHNSNLGYETGIIEFKNCYYFLDAVRLLERSGCLPDKTLKVFREWLTSYVSWLEASPQGKKACCAINHHGTFYDLQLASILVFLNEIEKAKDVFVRAESRLLQQIDESGVQVAEIGTRHTQHFVYLNAQGFLDISLLIGKTGFHPLLKNAQTILRLKSAVQWNLTLDQARWPLKHANSFDENRVAAFLMSAKQLGFVTRPDLPERFLTKDSAKPILNPYDGVQPFWPLRSGSSLADFDFLSGTEQVRPLRFNKNVEGQTAQSDSIVDKLVSAYLAKPATEADKPRYKKSLESLTRQVETSRISTERELRFFISALFKIGDYAAVESALNADYRFALDLEQPSWAYAQFALDVCLGNRIPRNVNRVKDLLDSGADFYRFGTNPGRLISNVNGQVIVRLSAKIFDWVFGEESVELLLEYVSKILKLRGEDLRNADCYVELITEIKRYLLLHESMELEQESGTSVHSVENQPQLIFICGFGWTGSGAVADFLNDLGVSFPFGTGELDFFESGSKCDWHAVVAGGGAEDLVRFYLTAVMGFYQKIYHRSGYSQQFSRSIVAHFRSCPEQLAAAVELVKNRLPVAFDALGDKKALVQVGFELLARLSKLRVPGQLQFVFNNAIHGKNVPFFCDGCKFTSFLCITRDFRDAYVSRIYDKALVGTCSKAEKIGRSLHRGRNKLLNLKNESVRLIQFEEFVGDSEERLEIAWSLGLGVSEIVGRKFDPAASSRNVGIWRDYENQTEIQILDKWQSKTICAAPDSE